MKLASGLNAAKYCSTSWCPNAAISESAAANTSASSAPRSVRSATISAVTSLPPQQFQRCPPRSPDERDVDFTYRLGGGSDEERQVDERDLGQHACGECDQATP